MSREQQHMESTPNRDGGRTVDGGGEPRDFYRGHDLAADIAMLDKRLARVEKMVEKIGKMVASKVRP